MKTIEKYQQQINAYICIWLMFAVLTAAFFGGMWSFGFDPSHAPRFGSHFAYKVNVWWDILLSPTYVLLGVVGFSIGKDSCGWHNMGAGLLALYLLTVELSLFFGGAFFSLKCLLCLWSFPVFAGGCFILSFFRKRMFAAVGLLVLAYGLFGYVKFCIASR